MAETLDEATRVRVSLSFHTVLGLGWSKRHRAGDIDTLL